MATRKRATTIIRCRRRLIPAALALSAAVGGCYFGDYCPVASYVAVQRTHLAGTWHISALGQSALPGLLSPGLVDGQQSTGDKVFLHFGGLGNLQYLGILSRDEETALWNLSFVTARAATALTEGLPGSIPLQVGGVRSTVEEMPDGTATVEFTWREREGDGAAASELVVRLEQVRFGATPDQLTALMSTSESVGTDPTPARTHLVGEVLLERIEPDLQERYGDIFPVGEITAVGGPAPPYNDAVTFGTGQWFALDARRTDAPDGATLSYYWHVVRERTDPGTGKVIERDRPIVLPGETSNLVANNPGRYYVTLYVTDGVLWRWTSSLGERLATTQYVEVE